MRGVKLAIAWCFAVAALFLFWEPVSFIFLKVYSDESGTPLSSVELVAVVILLLLGAVFVAGWWTVLKKRDSARTWATVASIIIAIIGFLMMRRRPIALPSRGWIPLAIGIAGVVVFKLTGTTAQPARNQIAKGPLPGDGTNIVVNNLVGFVGAAAGAGASTLWSRWADRKGLSEGLPPYFFLQILLAILLVLLIHESGHAIVAFAVGMKPTAIAVGPLEWWVSDGRWKFRFRPAGLVAFLGRTMVAPKEIKGFRRSKILQVAAGPFMSIVSGVIAAAAVLVAPGRPWENEWIVLSCFATISLLAGIFNLVPFGIGSGYSDGAKLYQLASGGLWCEYQLLLGVINACGVTPIRPRDYDIDTIQRATGSIARGMDELFMRLSAYAYFVDTGELSRAADVLAGAERFVQESALEPPMVWYPVFVFGDAYLRHDAVAARAWWDKLEARKLSKSTEACWLSLSALLWSENRLEEACEAWNKADASARRRPNSGFAAAERNAVRLLRQTLDESLAAR